MKNIIRSSSGALVAGMIAAGCSTAPPASEVTAANTALDNAGQAIDRAAADPHVAKYTTSELDRATASLHKAQEAWKDKHDLATTTHFAYLAQQRAATAQELANGRAADEALAMAASNRDQAVSSMMAERRSETPPPTASTAPTPSTGEAQQGLGGFAFGAATVPPAAKPAIDQVASTLKSNPGSKVVIEGYTDNVGSPAYNQNLALERAQAVRTALVREGVEAGRISVRAHGEENPIASNDTKEGRRENRRAQVIIEDAGGSMVGSSQGGTTSSSSGEGEQSGHTQQSAQPPQSGQEQQKGEGQQSGQGKQDEDSGQRKE
jgi:outer membrane protein OmpA-like peptidoglycan-associated protein